MEQRVSNVERQVGILNQKVEMMEMIYDKRFDETYIVNKEIKEELFKLLRTVNSIRWFIAGGIFAYLASEFGIVHALKLFFAG